MREGSGVTRRCAYVAVLWWDFSGKSHATHRGSKWAR